MGHPIVIVGASENADIAYEYFTHDSPHRVVAFSVERDYLDRETMNGLPIVPFEELEDRYDPGEHRVHVALSSQKLNRVRRRLFDAVKEKGFECVSYVSSRAFVWPNVTIGENVFVFENNVLQHHVEVGDNVILWSGNHIGHRTVIEADCFVSSHVVISGFCRIGRGSFLGVNACLSDGLVVGSDCVVGAGAVVVKDTEARGVYVGNPARATGGDAFATFGVEPGTDMHPRVSGVVARLIDPGYGDGPMTGIRAALARRAPGRRVTCPCCGGSFRRFIAGWGGTIHSCPACGSHERHRVLWLYLKERTRILHDELAVLHWAPEPGLERNLRGHPNLRYTTADLDPEWGAMAQMDITDIPEPDDTYDVILCSHVLEHVDDDARALAELLRVLRPGGWAILLVPIDRGRTRTYEDSAVVTAAGRERAFGQSDHVRFYGTDFPDRVAAAGFEVTVDRWAARLDPEVMRRYGLAPEELYVCRKPSGARG